jgi:hypothetical protein
MRTPTEATIALMQARFCGTPFFHLVKYSHADLPAPLYYCDDNAPITSAVDGTSQVYIPAQMAITLPVEDPTVECTGSIVQDNTLLDMSSMVNRCNGAPISCTIYVINSDDPDTVVAGPFPMQIQQAGPITLLSMQATLSYEQANDEQIPGDQMGPGVTPGIFAAAWYGQI